MQLCVRRPQCKQLFAFTELASEEDFIQLQHELKQVCIAKPPPPHAPPPSPLMRRDVLICATTV